MPTADGPCQADREYISVRPATTPLDPQHVRTALRTLHQTASDAGLAPIEMLLVTAGDRDGVTYLFGSEGIEADRLRRTLRRAFPVEYELRTRTTTLEALLTASGEETDDPTTLADRAVAGLEFQATEERAGDWQTQLQPFESFASADRPDWPLGRVVDALAAADSPVIYQTLLEPKPDWQSTAEETIEAYHYPQRTVIGRLVDAVLDPESVDERQPRDDVPHEYRRRIEEIEAGNTRRSFHVNTRVVALGGDTAAGDRPLDAIAGALTEVSRTTYELTATRYDRESDEAAALWADLQTRTLRGVSLSRRIEHRLGITIPFSTTTHPRIVADPTSAGSFCFLGGANLPEPAKRGIETRAGERTGLPLPPERVLEEFRGDGFAIGIPQTGDRTSTDEPLAVPPSLQHLHHLVAGGTGSGKSIWGVNGLLANHAATDGATIIIESKDGQMADDYERAHYAEYGSLESVTRFDAAEYVPATPFFDVTRQQASGIARSQAVEDVADHTEELLRAIMGEEQFDQAVASPLVIEALIKAMFDPVHGADQFALADLQQRIGRFAETGHAPPVIDAGLRRELQRIADNSADTFQEIVDGAARRIATAALDSRVAPLFNYAPQADGAQSDVDPIDWRRRLDEDCVIIIDTSALRTEPQRVVTLVILSQVWTALRRRKRERQAHYTAPDPPLVTLHIEEAATVAASGILADILREGRSFGIGVTLSLQYPRQLERVDRATYEEALTNIGTIVTGRVTDDPALATRLATDDMGPEMVANRLGRLAPGEWLASLPATFGGEPPRPILLESLPLPPGHAEGDRPLSPAQQATFQAAQIQRGERSRSHGIAVTRTASPGRLQTDTAEPVEQQPAMDTGQTAHSTIDTTLPFTRRLPDQVTYHAPSESIVCATCETRHGRRLPELLSALACHGSVSDVDRANVPTIHVGLTLSPGERSTSIYSDAQLAFLQVVYNAHQQRYDPDWEYDIVHDGMAYLRAYAGIDDDEFEQLVLDGLVSVDGDHPHTLYTVTPTGRETIDAAHREGTAHGDGVGDLSESSMHVMMVETIARVFEAQYVADPDHPGQAVERYHPVEDGRLDVAVCDAAGEVVIAAEAERSNHDVRRAVPADYDKMAACDPETALWIVEGRSEGHEVIRALHNPPSGEARVPKTYSESYALTRVSIDEPGFTDIYTIGSFRNQFLESARE